MSGSCSSIICFFFSLICRNNGDLPGRAPWFCGRRHLVCEFYDGFDAYRLANSSLICAYLAGLSSMFVKWF